MNLNDLVVLPNNKAKCIKLNVRNLQELRTEAVTMTEESKEMEEKLQQLKESMSKEKEERGHSCESRWKSGKCHSLNTNALTNSTKKEKENRLQKLLARKGKIRVLTDELMTGPPQPPPTLPPPAISLQTTRKNRLRGTCCGQCEVKTAGLMCAECTEDYCIACFTKFHQKGALKFHKMIPIQTVLQTQVSTPDVVSCFQKQINHSSHQSAFTSVNPSPKSKPCPNQTIKSSAISEQGDQNQAKGTEAVAKPTQLQPDPSQVLAVNHGEEKKVKVIEESLKREEERRFPSALLKGEFDEKESARSFQEALRQWRGEHIDGAEEPMSEDAMWRPVRSASVSGRATQADLALDRGADGLGRGAREGRVPVRVEFTENSLTYMDRLLLKKHRRTPIDTYSSSAFGADLNSLPDTNAEEETASRLTAQEEDFRRYCASLFALPIGNSRTEPQITTPESYLVLEVLDERDKDTHEDSVAEQRTDNSRKVSSVQQVLSQGRTLIPKTTLTSAGSSGVSISSPSPIQPSKQTSGPAPPKAAQGLRLSKPQTLQKEPSMKSLSSNSKPSACPSAETPRTSKTSIKARLSASQKPNCLPTVHKSKPDCGSPWLVSSPSLPHSQTEIPKSSHAPVSFPLDVPSLASAKPLIPEEHRLSPFLSKSYSLRSTFTVSPSGSTESTLLPKIYQSDPLQKGSDSSLLPEQQQRSQLFPELISSPTLSQSPPSNPESSRQSQHSLDDPESLLSDNQLQLPLSPETSCQNPPPKSIEASTPMKSLSSLSLFNDYPLEVYSRLKSSPTTEDAPIFMSSIPISGDHEAPLPPQDPQSIPSFSSHILHAIQNPPPVVTIKEEEELSIDSADEMSSDSLGLAPHEEESSDEEAQIQGWLTKGGSREEEQVNPALSHQEDFCVPADAEGENDLQTDEQEQLSEPSVVMRKQSAGSGSEQLSDLDEFPPLGLDTNSGHSDTPEHTGCDSLHTSQTPPYDSDQTGSGGYWPSSSSLGSYTDEHLVFRMMMDNQKQAAGFQVWPTTPSRRREKPANDLETSVSGSNLSGKFPPTLSREPSACCLSRPTSGSESGLEFRPLSQAAQEIMEICSVDKTGCEDPDLDTDTTTNTLHELEQELRLLTKERQASVFGAGNSGSEDQRGNHHYTRGRVSQEQKDEEAAAQRDRQSVLSLP